MKRDVADTEEQESFLDGFGSLGMQEDNAIDIARFKAREVKKENKQRRRPKKKGNANKEIKSDAKGTFIKLCSGACSHFRRKLSNFYYQKK